MMLRHSFDLEDEAQAVERAVFATIEAGCLTADIAPPGGSSCSTVEVGKAIAAEIRT
jgi:3-isopropylmalate dehydrogenase